MQVSSNNLLVGRFMTDVKKPEVVQNPFSKSDRYFK